MRPEPHAPPESTELSVVVPVYGCRDCLPALHRRLTETLRQTELSYELVFVDDRSPDGSGDVLLELAGRDPHVRVVRLSRNFGQHAAITAGLEASAGRWTVVMDCDLQEPPELIPELYAKAQEGYDVVFGRRRRRNDSWLRTMLARVYFRFQKAFLGNDLTGDYSTFSILSQRVREAFLKIRDQDRHYLPIIRWLGFEQTSIEFDHAERFAGRSSYSLRGLLRHAANGVFFQTTTLLIWIIWLGFALAFAGVCLAGYFAYRRIVNTAFPGWTSLVVVQLLVGGFIIISTGVTGLYIGKIFKQVKDRPLYVVEREVRGTAAPETPEPEPVEPPVSRVSS